MQEGWKCPNCGGAHGPHVDSCPVGQYAPPDPNRKDMTIPAYPLPMTPHYSPWDGAPPQWWQFPVVIC